MTTELATTANIALPPIAPAELEFNIIAACESQDPQQAWDPIIINGLGWLYNEDYTTFGRLKALISAKFGKAHSPTEFQKAVRLSAQRQKTEAVRAMNKNFRGIQTNNRPLRDMAQDTILALRRKNEPPVLFARSNEIVQVTQDEQHRAEITPLREPQLRRFMDDAENYLIGSDAGFKVIPPPKELVTHILGMTPYDWGFPSLTSLVAIPTLRADGTVLERIGYDQQSSMYYMPADKFEMPPVPDDITRDDLDAAVGLVDEMICDFPMANAASRANYFALLITPVIRPAIDGVVPLAIIEAPQAGTGKTLLTQILCLIVNGQTGPQLTLPNEEPEVRKTLASGLAAGRALLVFDNFTGQLRSPELCMALTSPIFETRALGTNKMLNLNNRATWAITGNNLRAAGDMPRRCYLIRIDARSSQPYVGRTFRHADLRQWVSDNRGRLLHALLVIACAWFRAGRPPAMIPALGSFEEWSRMLGGILAYAGVGGFLDNAIELMESDDDAIQWERLLDDMQDIYPDGNWFTVKTIAVMMREQGQTRLSIPDSLAEVDLRKENSMERVLGRAFGNRRGRRYGDKKGLYLQKYLEKGKNSTYWRVMDNALDQVDSVIKRQP